MTAPAEPEAAEVDWPRIPTVAWQRGIGVPCETAGRPRVPGILDDGEFAGVPIGGLGTGSIGRTYRGDAARWHLEVGRHRHEPVAADAFSLFVSGPDGGRATVLSALRPDDLPAWDWTLPVGGGTYHALFPRAWQAFEPEMLGVRLVGEQLSPVIAGDLGRSALPVGAFEWWIENPGPAPVTVGLLFSWADPFAATGPASARPHGTVVDDDGTRLVVLGDPGAAAATALRGTLAIAVAAGPGIELSSRAWFDPRADVELWADFAADGRLDRDREPRRDPGASDEAGGAALCATVELPPGARRSVRFAMAWDLPIVEFGAGRRWWKRYTRSWGRTGERAADLARLALGDAPAWRAAIEAWQRPYLDDTRRPDWYVTALFNELYFLVDGGSFWEAGEVGGVEPPPDDVGRFALLESADYPFYDTVDVDFYASFALLELFPALELRGIRDLLAAIPIDDPSEVVIEATGGVARRKIGGTVPHDVGGPGDDPFVRPNWYRFQDVNDWKDLGPKFVLQAWRDIIAADALLGRAGGDALAAEVRPTVEDVLTRLARSDRDGDGLPEHDGVPDQTYDTWPMRGPSAYGGSLWLAAVAAAAAIAARLGAADAAERWEGWLERAQATFERRLWRGDHYAYDDGAGPSSDSVMADQLAGQWYADASSLGDIVAADRVAAALRTVHRTNVCGFRNGAMGAVNGMRPDGSVDDSSEQSSEVWVGTSYALAAFMIGRGLVNEGWETARGVAATTYGRGLWFRTPEAYDADGNFRASIYLRPLAIWAIEEALRRARQAPAPAADIGAP